MDNANKPDPDVDTAIPLRDVDSISVEPMHQNITEIDAAAGRSYLEVTSTTPDLTTVLVHRPPNLINELTYADSGVADQVAKAVNHAVSLCGGNATLKD
jgi:hypothetical protein